MFRLLFFISLVLYVFSRFIPSVLPDDYVIVDGIDDGWTQALHLAFAHRLQFGTDFVFTYGPWGFLARGYLPATYWLAVGSWGVLSVVYLCAGWRLARHYSTHWLVAGLWLVALTVAATFPLGEDFNNRLAAWSLLLLCLHFFVEDLALTPLQIALVVSLGWMSLVKFTGLVESAAVIGIIAADNVFRQRRFPWVILLWPASLLIFWRLAGQHLKYLAGFLSNSWRITSGYTDAMMLAGKQEGLHLFIFLMLAGGFGLLLARIGWLKHRLWGALPLAGCGVILFISFKLGYVRYDGGHETPAAMILVLAALTALAVARPVAYPTAAAGLLMAAALFAAYVFHFWLPGNGLGKQIARSFSPTSLFAPFTASYSGYLSNGYEQAMAKERKRYPLPSLVGTADLYSYSQTRLFAQPCAYQPRPVVQSYSAYTPELAELNAEHLQSDRAAERLLFAVQTIDGRFPSLDDGRSWPELLTRYDILNPPADGGEFLLLSRATVPGQFHLTPLGGASVTLDQDLPVPSLTNGPIWAEIEIKKTRAGALRSLFYKPAELMITVALPGHRLKVYRLISGMAAGGFLLSPVINDARTFAALAMGGAGAVAATWDAESIKISADINTGSATDYQSPLTVRFYRLDYSLPNGGRQSP